MNPSELLPSLVHLRWMAIGLQVSLVGAECALSGSSASVGWSAGLVALGAMSNLALGKVPPRRDVSAAVLALDLVLLTGLLAVTQGTANPFTALYVVYVAIGAAVLSARGAVGVVVIAIAAYALLFFAPQDPHAHHRAMENHLLGMWLAFAVSAPFVAYTIATARNRLAAAQRRTQQSEKLVSLGTLAAGAAHELSTPLSSIAVATSELSAHCTTAEGAADLALIQQEVARCKRILRQLSANAGHPAGPPPQRIAVEVLLRHACEGLDEGPDVVFALGEAGKVELIVPVEPLALGLRGLINNGLDASDDDSPVTLRASLAPNALELHIVDLGGGIHPADLSRVGEPFFTTKEADEGMGLGVFFARSVVEQMAGSLLIQSNPGAGTTATVRLPLDAVSSAGRTG
jgi:two-component system, sensor histidine kinase RegB